MHTLVLYIILALLLAACVIGYALILKSYMTKTAVTIGKPDMLDGLTGVAWLQTKLMGWKTHLLLLVAAGWQLASVWLQSGLTDWSQLPWASIFEGKVANYVTFGLALLASLTHATGLAKVASIPPQD